MRQMKRIDGAGRWSSAKRGPLFLALGNFDGVHRGHQTIIGRAVALAREAGGVSAALVFDPHPARLLFPGQDLQLLTDLEKKAFLMERIGLDCVVVEPFTAGFASLEPELFVKNILVGKLNVRAVVVGRDYSFGQGGRGRAEAMTGMGSEHGFAVEICPLVMHGGVTVSSSLIRALVLEGRVREAAGMLNYHFFRCGRVIAGRGIGQKLLFPTANLAVDPGLLWPGPGVYLTAVEGAGPEPRFGVTNVGARPTFQEQGMSVETHILDFEGSLYGRILKVYFLEKLRETAAFPGPEALRSRIEADIAEGRRIAACRYRRLETGFLDSGITASPFSPSQVRTGE